MIWFGVGTLGQNKSHISPAIGILYNEREGKLYLRIAITTKKDFYFGYIVSKYKCVCVCICSFIVFMHA